MHSIAPQRAKLHLKLPVKADTILGPSRTADARFEASLVDLVMRVLEQQRPGSVRMARWFWVPIKITPEEAYAALEQGVEMYFQRT